MATSIGQYTPVFLPGEPHLTEKPGRPQSTMSQSWTWPKWPCLRRCNTFFCLWQICPSASWARKWLSCLACRDPGGVKCARDMDCLLCRRYGPIRVFFQASCNWQSEGLFGQSFSIAPPIQALRWLPRLKFFSVVQCIRHIEGTPLPTTPLSWLGSYSVDGHLNRHPGWGPTL